LSQNGAVDHQPAQKERNPPRPAVVALLATAWNP
jgi:hypothetical protein